jgi:hypothetical protein
VPFNVFIRSAAPSLPQCIAAGSGLYTSGFGYTHRLHSLY